MASRTLYLHSEIFQYICTIIRFLLAFSQLAFFIPVCVSFSFDIMFIVKDGDAITVIQDGDSFPVRKKDKADDDTKTA